MTEDRSSGKAHWTIDADDVRTLVGLTADETSEYFSLLHAEAEVSCQEAQDRLRALRKRHLAAAGGKAIPENGGGAGVRLKRPRKAAP
ncbi:hypothetical protein [Teichococcus aestuarii]|uniref:hypothetical protein n=1 Tax=Teichococcus aestuarii TaxID=568898 RepID=UPI00360CFAED